MKKYCNFVLAVLLFMGMCQGAAFAENGGSESQPQLISTIEQLDQIRYQPNGNYQLENDILIYAGSYEAGKWVPNRRWDPIGWEQQPFTGTFDGNGHRILFSIGEDQGYGYVGLFGVAKNACIKNVTVAADIKVNSRYAGAVAAYAEDSSFENCVATGSINIRYITKKDKETSYAGGICGYAKNCTFLSCGSKCPVTINGLADEGFYYCYVCDQYHLLPVCGGGLIGATEQGTVSRCYAIQEVSVSSKRYRSGAGYSCHTGGLIGINGSTVEECYATGPIFAEADYGGDSQIYAGGLIGENKGNVCNSYTSGSIMAKYGLGVSYVHGQGMNSHTSAMPSYVFSQTGLMVGRNVGKLENCYAAGTGISTFRDEQSEDGGSQTFRAGFVFAQCNEENGKPYLKQENYQNCYSIREYVDSEINADPHNRRYPTSSRDLKTTYSHFCTPQDLEQIIPMKTIAQLQDKSTYEAWDFQSVWDISAERNDGLPYLRNNNLYQ